MSTAAFLEILLGVLLTISAIATVAVLWPGRPGPRRPLPLDPPPSPPPCRPPVIGTRHRGVTGRRRRTPVSPRPRPGGAHRLRGSAGFRP